MNYTIEIPKETEEEIQKMLNKALTRAMLDIERDIVEHLPGGRTGATRNSVWGEVKDNTIIMHAGGAIVYIEFGTPPHLIKPIQKQALFWEGAEHPVKVVHHPGTAPNPVMMNAIQRGLMIYLPNRLQEVFSPWAG